MFNLMLDAAIFWKIYYVIFTEILQDQLELNTSTFTTQFSPME